MANVRLTRAAPAPAHFPSTPNAFSAPGAAQFLLPPSTQPLSQNQGCTALRGNDRLIRTPTRLSFLIRNFSPRLPAPERCRQSCIRIHGRPRLPLPLAHHCCALQIVRPPLPQHIARRKSRHTKPYCPQAHRRETRPPSRLKLQWFHHSV